MRDYWWWSDQHFGHENLITKFKLADGVTPSRPFSNVDEMDETMIQRYNERVKDQDYVYFGGDLSFDLERVTKIMARLKGRKTLVPGNHDHFDAGVYQKWFKGGCIPCWYRWPKPGPRGQRFVLSHCPLHPSSFARLGGGGYCVHGHMHHGTVKALGQVLDDPRYVNICVEKTDYAPINLDELWSRIK